MNPHLHKYRFECETVNGHKHILSGYTENVMGISALHVHVYHGVCSSCGHTHHFSGRTGLPVKTRNGHIHKMEGVLEMSDRHEHPYSSYTFEDVEYIDDPIPNGIYVL